MHKEENNLASLCGLHAATQNLPGFSILGAVYYTEMLKKGLASLHPGF